MKLYKGFFGNILLKAWNVSYDDTNDIFGNKSSYLVSLRD